MTRERGEDGALPPLAHVRLEQAPKLRQIAVQAMSEDPASPTFSTAQKVAIANNVIDHLKDGARLKGSLDPLDRHPITERFQTIAKAALQRSGLL